ncbi:MAG: heme lyase CcmF/NrfE family subunit [Gammaproteobacteria bacterium]
MIPELGQFALIVALCLALVQGIMPLVGAYTRNKAWMAIGKPAAAGQFVFVLLSFLVLAWAFIENDFSVTYVASHSNSALPLMYRISAVWGAHEGSLLLWILILNIWIIAAIIAGRNLPEVFNSRVIGVLGLVAVGFLMFILFTSNPFDRLIPAALDGRDLNPLLQDPALAIHPPMLYFGYVGLAVPFAYAIAVLLEGRTSTDWARWAKPWATMSWVCLTLGIALGSWWAYYELGWGGWWFWDPVENASFMPWLMGTALIHSLTVTEKRGLFKSWTLLLAISGFSLSLLGTFLVRSGVLVSVHAFASDPARGFFILVFLTVVVGSALTLYAWRAPKMASNAGFAVFSRESFLLANNVLLVIATLVVLLGTLFPLVMDALGQGKYSVGPQYFGAVFVIPTLPMVLLLGVGMHTAWRRDNSGRVKRHVSIAAALAVALGIAIPLIVYGGAGVLSFVGIIAAFWVMIASLVDPVAHLRKGQLGRMPRAMWGMTIAHFGLGVFILGAVVTSTYSVERDEAVRIGESTAVGQYDFRFDDLSEVEGPNFTAVEATVSIFEDGREITTLHPQKRVYRVHQSPMTEAGIDAKLRRDLFVALGDPLGGNAWSLRVQYKPLVRLIWLGCILMAIGGLVAVSDRRYSTVRQKSEARVPAGAAGETS